MRTVRDPAVAGLFYPGRRSELADTVARLLDDARRQPVVTAWRESGRAVPKALLLPHAGYVYSGSTAALGYALLEAGRGRVTRVVLLGPTHRVAVNGLALPEADALRTPLGEVRTGMVSADVRRALPQVVDSAVVHEQEHSLEVHLPFVQTVLGDVEVVPLAVGRAGPEEVADVLDALWGGEETVVVVSSDLSHYLPYDFAEAMDGSTVDQILRREVPLTHDQACGATPANGLLVVAVRRGLEVELLGRCSSGDTAGDRRRVVGYAAVAFSEPG